MLTIGGGEMFVIILLALVMFGPRKLPELFRTVTKYYGDFKRATNDLKSTFEHELHSLDQDTRDIKASLERELMSVNEVTRDLHLEAQKTAQELTDHASYNYGLGNDHEEQNPYLIASAQEAPHETTIEGSGAQGEQPASEHPILDATVTENHAAEVATPAANELEMVSLPAFIPATEGTVARAEAVAHQTPLTVADEIVHEADPDPVHHA